MADLEKVIKGFEQCWEKEPNTRNCNECPYKKYLHKSRGESCADRMHLDALELLKEYAVIKESISDEIHETAKMFRRTEEDGWIERCDRRAVQSLSD